MHRYSDFILRLVLAFVVIGAFPRVAFSNDAQAQFVAIGTKLGIIEAQFELFYRINGEIPLPLPIESVIESSLSLLVEDIDAAEEATEPLFDSARKEGIQATKKRIADFRTVTRRYTLRQKAAYIRGIAGVYKNTLAMTIVSSRPDSMQAKPNCDSSYFDFGYDIGRTISAGMSPPSGRRQGNVDIYQQDAFGGAINAIDQGLRISVGGFAPGRASDNAEKVCCSFGTKSAWDAFKQSVRWNSSLETLKAAYDKRLDEIRSDGLTAGACGGEPARVTDSDHSWLYGRWRVHWVTRSGIKDCILTIFQQGNLVEGCSFGTKWNAVGNDPVTKLPEMNFSIPNRTFPLYRCLRKETDRLECAPWLNTYKDLIYLYRER